MLNCITNWHRRRPAIAAVLFGLLAAVLASLPGCDSQKPKDLGTVIYEIPHVKDAEKPYPVPELGLPEPKEKRPDQ